MTAGLGERTPSAAAVAALVHMEPSTRTVRVGDLVHTVAEEDDAVHELSVWLYMALHAGNTGIFAPSSILPDTDFEDEISGSVRETYIPTPLDRAGAPVPPDGQLVELHRVRLLVPPDQLDTTADGRPAVRMPSRRPQLSPGFYMFVHDQGSWGRDSRVTRLYVRHDDPRAALADWRECIDRLSGEGLVFRTKILSRRDAYPRNDALVFYASEDADRLAEVITDPALAGRRPANAGSPLCVPRGAGVTAAEDPRDPRPGTGQKSFGEHRCQVVADAVLATLRTGVPLAETLAEACTPANVDPANLARNADSDVRRVAAA